jgi:hypothetical protein
MFWIIVLLKSMGVRESFFDEVIFIKTGKHDGVGNLG